MTELNKAIHSKIVQGACAQILILAIVACFSPYAQEHRFEFGYFAGIILTSCLLRLLLPVTSLVESHPRIFKYVNSGLTLMTALSLGILTALDIKQNHLSGGDDLIIPMAAAGNAAAASTSLFYDLKLNRAYILSLFVPHFLLFLFEPGYNREASTGFTLAAFVFVVYIWREGAAAHQVYWRNSQLRDQAIEKQKEIEISRAFALGSARLAAVGELAGGIAHELNNPLTIVRGTAGILLDHSQRRNLSDDLLVPSLERIQKTVDRMTKIVRSLLNFAQQTHQDETVRREVSYLIEEALDFSQDRLKRLGVELRIEIENVRNIWVQDRGTQISQALLNLLNNAADAVTTKPDPWIAIKTKILDQHVIIHIEDSGAGIPERNRPLIFQPFFTTKSQGEGTGLGLSISRALVENLGGELHFDPECPHTRFVLKLPCSKT